MRRCLWLVMVGTLLLAKAAAQVAEEPVALRPGEPQFFVDDWLVDNRFAIKYKTNAVVRVPHALKKHEANPVLRPGGYVNVLRDKETGVYHLWSQVHHWPEDGDAAKTQYGIQYAESEDGLSWEKPDLDLVAWNAEGANNIVWRGPSGYRASGPQLLLDLPEKDRRGHRYVMTYRTSGAGKGENGIRLIGSEDGIHWDAASDTLIQELHSDTLNSIVYNPGTGRYLMSCRAKDRYRLFKGDMIDTGASRRVAFLESESLWDKQTWAGSPRAGLIPDEIDGLTRHHFFYGMPMRHFSGIYWGFLWVFRMNDPIHTELVTSRDGLHWHRAPGRAPLVPLGEEGEWDHGMIFAGPHWIEVGDEWWFYYAAYNEGHESKTRTSGIGLARCRKERLVSLRGPVNGGGVVVTRRLRWPGGDLVLNVDASGERSEVKVRISGERRQPVEGFDYEDCEVFQGDAVRHRVRWGGGERSLDEKAGEVLRVEVFLQGADLFALLAE